MLGSIKPPVPFERLTLEEMRKTPANSPFEVWVMDQIARVERPTLPDEFGIGQVAVARIQMETAQQMMSDAAPRAFACGYISAEVRAAARDTFNIGRRAYETAKAVYEAHKEEEKCR